MAPTYLLMASKPTNEVQFKGTSFRYLDAKRNLGACLPTLASNMPKRLSFYFRKKPNIKKYEPFFSRKIVNFDLII